MPSQRLTGVDWNPLHWARNVWDDIWHVGSSVVNAIVDAVSSAIDLLANAANDAINWVHDTLSDAIMSALDGIQRLWHAIDDVLNKAWHFADNVWHSLDDFIRRVAADVWGGISNALHQAIDFAGNVLQSALHAIEHAVGWVWNEAQHLVERAWHDLQNWTQNAIDLVIRDIIGPILRFADQIWHDIYPMFKWFTQAIVDIIEICIKAAEWLIWFGEHTFEFFYHLGSDLVTGGVPGVFDADHDPNASHFAAWESGIERMWGGH